MLASKEAGNQVSQVLQFNQVGKHKASKQIVRTFVND